MLANYKIESSNYILRIASKDKGRLLLQNKQSETLVQLGELKLGRWPQLELENNCKYEIIEVDVRGEKRSVSICGRPEKR